MINNNSQVIEKVSLTKNLKHTVSVAYDESKVFLEINYMNGKFILQKTFTNNYVGINELETTRKEFNNEEKVKEHFGI